MLRAPLRTARAMLIMLVVQGATLAVMLVALLACALVGGLVIESAARVLPWLPGSAVIAGVLVTVVSLTAFWWALRAWYASATFTRLRSWTWRYLDEPFHDPRRPEGQEWVFAPHDDFPRYFATEAEARQCATGWVATRDQLPAPGAHRK